MLNSKSFLAADFGAGSLKLAEFEPTEAERLRLKQYGYKSLGAEGAQEATREEVLVKALHEVLSEKSFGSKQINVCAPGFHVFSKFVKLPPVDASKVTQIIRYEAQQNVPFPLDEVVWDYQILGTTATNELEVLLVAVKSEIVEGLSRSAEGAGLRLKLVDVSPAALCNAFRYNYGDLDGCTMLLDIGAKTSNLLFFEKGKIYSRSINIGANSITQDFANESKLRFAEAEAVKIEKGSVGLGGAYADPEDPQAAAISKISRQVMTRLHIQVNQTIQFFRGQQGGTKPQRLFLSGGASIMPYTAQFFAEKLDLPVDYFNPFRNIELDPALDLDELSKYAHSFGEVVGLGLRDLAHCPVELNLMPRSSIQSQEFAHKKPFLIAAIFILALTVFALYFAENRAADIRRGRLEEAKKPLDSLTLMDQKLQTEQQKRDRLKHEADQMEILAGNRFYWDKVFTGLRDVFASAEKSSQASFRSAENNGTNTEIGVWIVSLEPVLPNGSPFAGASSISSGSPFGGGSAGGFERGRGRGGMRGMAPAPVMAAPVAAPVGNAISTLNLLCRGVNRLDLSPSANSDIAYAVLQNLTNSPFFTDKSTLGEDIAVDDGSNTFHFKLTVQLKQPFKL